MDTSATTTEPLERPDLSGLGLSDDQLTKWNAVADKLERLNRWNASKFIDKTKEVFTHFSDSEARDKLLGFMEKPEYGYHVSNFTEMWEKLAERGEQLAPAHRELASFISTVDNSDVSTMARSIDSFVDKVDPNAYVTVLGRAAELAADKPADGKSYFTNADDLFSNLSDEQNDRIYTMGKEYEDGSFKLARSQFFTKAANTFKRLDEDVREHVIEGMESYYQDSKPLAYSFMNASGDVRGVVEEAGTVAAWEDTADSFSDPELRKRYFDDSYAVLRQVKDRDKVLGIVKDVAQQNEAMGAATFKAGQYIEEAKASTLSAWADVGASYYDPVKFVDKTKTSLSDVNAKTITQIGDVANRISQKDIDVADRVLDRTQTYVRSYDGHKRGKLFRMVEYAVEEGEGDAAKEVLQSHDHFKDRSLKDVRKWIDVSRGLDDQLKKSYFDRTKELIDDLGNRFMFDWVKTANVFAGDPAAYKFFENSKKVIPTLEGKPTKRAFELTRELAGTNGLAAAEFFNQLQEQYDPGQGDENLETWAAFGKELMDKRLAGDGYVGERYFAHTGGITDILRPDAFGVWKEIALRLTTDDARKAVLYHSRDELAALEQEGQDKYLHAVEGINEKLVETVVKKAAAFTPFLGKEELDTLNTLAYKLNEVTDKDEYAPYHMDAKLLEKVTDKGRLFEMATMATEKKRASLARAILENGRALEGMNDRSLKQFIREGTTINEDDFTSSGYYYSSSNAIDAATYGAFVRSIPFLAEMSAPDYLTWKGELDSTTYKGRKEDLLKNTETFFRTVKPEDRQQFFDYHATIYERNDTAAISDLKELGRLSKFPDMIKDFVLGLGEKLSVDYSSQMNNYLNNTITSMEAVKDPQQLAAVYQAEQKVEVVDTKLAKAFMENFGVILKEFDGRVLQDWAEKGLDVYKEHGVDAAEKFFKLGLTRGFMDDLKEKYHYVAFEDIQGSAGKWVGGILEKPVGVDIVKGSAIAYTDNNTIFIPKRVDAYTDNDQNRMLYWGLMDHEMSHIKYDSFAVEIKEAVKEYEKQGLAKHIWNLLEDGRIEHNLRDEYGGLISEELDLTNAAYIMKPLEGPEAQDPGQQFMSALLQKVKMGTTVTQIDPQYQAPFDQCYDIYKTESEPGTVYDTWSATRKVYDIVTDLFPQLTEPQDQQPGDDVGDHGGDGEPQEGQGGGESGDGEPQDGQGDGGESGDDEGDDQDGGGGDGDDQGDDQQDGDGDPQQGGSGKPQGGSDAPPDPDQGGGGDPTDRNEVIEEFKYDEWDSTLSDYLYEFCTVKEIIREKASTEFYSATIRDMDTIRRQIIDTMSELKPAHLEKERRLPEGSDVDMDAYTDAWGERRATGHGMDDKIFEESRKQGRDVAVCILVDQSGSTYGNIIKKSKESMILMSEALDNLGDQFAIYGFDTSGKDDVRVYRVKSFEEDYNGITHGRIEGMEPGSMTKMGPAMRHAMAQLDQTDARTKIFLYLTDGEPNDYSDSPNKQGKDYVFNDIRKAIDEGHNMGIQSYAMAIDSRGGEYLETMFGHGNYCVLDNVDALPERLSDFYSEITETT